MRAKHISMGLILFLTGFSFARAEVYRPYPVIFIHGINSNATTWGFAFADSEITRGVDLDIIDHSWRFEQHTAARFGQLMRPYIWTRGRDTLWYIATLNFDDFGGSIDPGEYDSDNRIKYYYARIVNGDTIADSVDVTLNGKGSGAELKHFIKKVLWTYYGDAWNLNPNAKVVLVTYFTGCQTTGVDRNCPVTYMNHKHT